MKIILWDKETFGFDDYIGGGDLGVNGIRLGEMVEKWVPLQQHKEDAGEVLVQITIE